MIDCAFGIYSTKNDHSRLGGTDSEAVNYGFFKNWEYFNPILLPLLRNMFSIAKIAFPKTVIILNGLRNFTISNFAYLNFGCKYE
jgi:hypothetical protein